MTKRPPNKALGVIALVVFGGAMALGLAITGWETADLVKYIGFLTVAILAVAAKLSIPSRAGNVPPTFLFVLIGALELSGSETVILAVAMALCQSLWHPAKNQRRAPMAFHIASMALASSVMIAIYDSSMGLPGSVPQVVRFGIATVTFCLLQATLVASAVSFSEDSSFVAAWRIYFFSTMPLYFGGAFVAFVFALTTRIVGWQTILVSGPIIYLIYKAYHLHVSRLENQRKHAEDVSALHFRTIQALALAIEAKDQTTHSHLARVQVYARELGRDLKLSEPEQQALMAASLLHDIGKLAVPESIISKPGRLTPEEFEKMKIHPTVGAEILEHVQFPYPVVPIVRAHHERWDGTGYPAGLKGEEIPIGARIISVVDCLDALASDRQYRRALPLAEAMKVVEKDSGKAFDPQVVNALKERYIELEQLAKAEGGHDGVRLSTEVKVDRGDAPAAGFEAHAAPPPPSVATTTSPVGSIASARHDVQSLLDLARQLGGSLTADDTLSMLAMRLRRQVPYHCLVIWRRSGETLEPIFVQGDESRLFSSLRIPIGAGLSGWVAENHKPIVNGNPAVESSYLGDGSLSSSLRSAMAVPLEGLNGVIGVLSLYHADRDAFSKEHLRLIHAVSAKIAMSMEDSLRANKAVAPVDDSAKGVLGAHELFQRLELEMARARTENVPVTLIVMNMEGTEQLVARFGPVDAARSVKSFALAMKSVCRDRDVIASVGNEEFVALLYGARPDDVQHRVAQFRRLLVDLCEERYLGNLLALSLGVASYPADGDDQESVLAQADRRMYAEKRDYKSRQSLPLKSSDDPFLSRAIH
jgi:diguanylate cyclase (GGDEF)-like protein/putative nucleotidyltransferase with HDIG domain